MVGFALLPVRIIRDFKTMSPSLAEYPGTIRPDWLWRALRLARVAAVVYLVVLLVLLLLENKLVFHATRDSNPPPADIHAQEIELRMADDTQFHAWWCPPPEWRPSDGAVLYCHGTGGNVSHRAKAIRTWQTEMGEAVLVFDYPGYGRSEGSPSEAGCYAAAEAAYDWLIRAAQVPPEKLLIFGGSLGGGPATHLAADRAHRILVLLCTFTSVPDVSQDLCVIFPARWLVKNQFDNRANLARCSGPVFLAHGTADRVVPFGHGVRLFAAAREPKAFLRLEGVPHSEFPPPEFFAALRGFLDGVERAAPHECQDQCRPRAG